MIRLEDKNRKYKRFAYTAKEKTYFATYGLRWVSSSNVSAVGTNKESLIIRFVNGSLYEYPNQADKIDELFNSVSKGKWVWDKLRGRVRGVHKVPYRKIGTMPLPDDIGVTDEEVFDRIADEALQVQKQLEALGFFVAQQTAGLDLISLNRLLA